MKCGEEMFDKHNAMLSRYNLKIKWSDQVNATPIRMAVELAKRIEALEKRIEQLESTAR